MSAVYSVPHGYLMRKTSALIKKNGEGEHKGNLGENTNLAPTPRKPGQHLPARQHLRRAPFALLGFPELGSSSARLVGGGFLAFGGGGGAGVEFWGLAAGEAVAG